MENTLKRLEILESSKVITKTNKEHIIKFLEYIFENVEDDRNTDMLITHLSMVHNRINSNSYLDKIDNDIFEEIENSLNFSKVKEILDYYENTILNYKIPEYEKPYIYIHLINLIEGV